jgi:hypothetical protein
MSKFLEVGYLNFMLICLWHPQSRAYFVKCVQSNTEWTLDGLKASGASKAAIVDTVLAMPRMILVVFALLFFNIVYFVS